MPSKSKRSVARRKHLRAQDKPVSRDKAVIVQQLHALGWRGRDLAEILQEGLTMRQNLERFLVELRSTVKRRGGA